MIKEELALQIDELKAKGVSLREIAKKLNLNREYVRRYTNNEIEIEPETDIKKHKTDTNSYINDINNLKSEMKEYIDRQLENYSVSITKDDLEDFRKDIINQARKDIYRIEKQIEQIEGRIRNLEQTDKQDI